jgi:S-adenosylmethionine:tRNA ribosyltransferase-isomerase
MQTLLSLNTLEFELPPELEAHEPPEARGLRRDQVRLMVSCKRDAPVVPGAQANTDAVIHTKFHDLQNFLEAGDVLVINTSGTLPAALPTTRNDGTKLELHLSTHLPGDLWTVELRAFSDHGTLSNRASSTQPLRENLQGETLELPGGASVQILAPYLLDRVNPPKTLGSRLWLAILELREPLLPYLERFGKAIRYGYVPQDWPMSTYQTVYATEPGSAEMPSAGRAFTPELITQLVAKGVQIAPLILHTGVASLEDHEPPFEEFYRVPLETARTVNQARVDGRRVIAVGTTVVRALETVTDAHGISHPGSGWTREIITPERGVKSINGILTGWHEPKATHLAMLEAIAGRHHLEVAYTAALENRYLWHEFGDLHLILP